MDRDYIEERIRQHQQDVTFYNDWIKELIEKRDNEQKYIIRLKEMLNGN